MEPPLMMLVNSAKEWSVVETRATTSAAASYSITDTSLLSSE